VTDRAYLKTPLRTFCNDQIQYGHIDEAIGFSTVEELHAFMQGYNRSLAALGDYPGISKISVQTGTSHGGVVLPDGSLFGEGVKTRLKEHLMEECNLHTIVRLPNSVFKPYASIGTNLLFFEKAAFDYNLYYNEQFAILAVRADETYLRQDFSVLQPVEDAAPWPYFQRFDYLVRQRIATPGEVNDCAGKPVSADYPQRDALLFALRELTGVDVGASSAEWKQVVLRQWLKNLF
jgi:hypothetical protein